MPETKVLGPGGATKRPTLARVVRRLKIGAAVIVLGAGAYVYETGWLGWGYAEAVDRVLPSDEDLLGWIPIDEATVVVLDTHRFHFGALGPPDGGLRAGVGSFVSDFKKATGVDLAFQVDKVAIARTVAAARGRFDAKKIANRLAELHYMPLDRGGFTYFAKRGEDAFAVLGDSVLLYGTEEGVALALDAHGSGANLGRDDATLARLKEAGWSHPLLVSMRVTDDTPSVRSIVSGTGGPRSVTVAATATPQGLDLYGTVDLASPAAAADFAKTLGARTTTEKLAELVGDDLGAALEPIAKHATVGTSSAEVKVRAHADPAEVDAASRAAAKPGRILDWLLASKIVSLFKTP